MHTGAAPRLRFYLNDPTLFFLAGIENICKNVAEEVIDATASNPATKTKHWSSKQPDAAITDFVSDVMALAPSDQRAAPAKELLQAHFTEATQQPGVTPTQALRSTFVVACQAPSAISVGL